MTGDMIMTLKSIEIDNDIENHWWRSRVEWNCDDRRRESRRHQSVRWRPHFRSVHYATPALCLCIFFVCVGSFLSNFTLVLKVMCWETDSNFVKLEIFCKLLTWTRTSNINTKFWLFDKIQDVRSKGGVWQRKALEEGLWQGLDLSGGRGGLLKVLDSLWPVLVDPLSADWLLTDTQNDLGTALISIARVINLSIYNNNVMTHTMLWVWHCIDSS